MYKNSAKLSKTCLTLRGCNLLNIYWNAPQNHSSGGSRGATGMCPLWVQILSFWHTNFSKHSRLGSWHPPMRLVLPLWEILDLLLHRYLRYISFRKSGQIWAKLAHRPINQPKMCMKIRQKLPPFYLSIPSIPSYFLYKPSCFVYIYLGLNPFSAVNNRNKREKC